MIRHDWGAWPTEVISVDGPDGWGSTRQSLRGQKWCPWWLNLVDDDNAVFDYPVPCKSFTHRSCAEEKVKWHLDHLQRHFGPWDGIWVASCDYTPELAGRLRQRRLQAQGDRHSGLAQYVWVRLNSGLVFVYSNVDLGGRRGPGSGLWMAPFDAYEHLRTTALVLPGVGDASGRKGINYSREWRLVDDRKPGTTKRFGGGRAWSEKYARIACNKLGLDPPFEMRTGSTVKWQPPVEVDAEVWREALEWGVAALDGRLTLGA